MSDSLPLRSNFVHHNAALGLLVHRTFEISFRNDTSFEAAWTTARAEEKFSRIDFDGMKSFRRTYLRALKRHEEIVRVISDHGGKKPEPELDLHARGGRIIGTVDLFVDGDSPFVLDYKTGVVEDAEGNLQESVSQQLHIYAGMILQQQGLEIPTGYIVSMTAPPIKVQIDQRRATELLDEMLESMDKFNSALPALPPANPEPEICHWCRHIHRCDDLRAAVEARSSFRPGNLEIVWGTVLGTPQISRSGLAAVRIGANSGTIEGEFTIFDVPGHLTQNLADGSHVMISGISHSSSARVWIEGITQLFVQ